MSGKRNQFFLLVWLKNGLQYTYGISYPTLEMFQNGPMQFPVRVYCAKQVRNLRATWPSDAPTRPCVYCEKSVIANYVKFFRLEVTL